MRKSEVADLISMARGFDDRIEEVEPAVRLPDGSIQEDARVTAWHLILADVDYELACRGLAELYQEPQMMRLQPGHVYQAAERVRRRNVKNADMGALTPPQGLEQPDGTTRHAEWMQAAVAAIGRGASVEDAQEHADHVLGVARRAVGPAVRRDPLELVRGRGTA